MDPTTINEHYNDAPQPVHKSEMYVLLDQGVQLRQHINELTKKRDALQSRQIAKQDEFDEVEYAQMLDEEAARVSRLRVRYDQTIIEKEEERMVIQNRVESITELKRSIQKRIYELKNRHIIEGELALIEDNRKTSEQELAMHKATLKNNPTNVQRVYAKRGKLGAEAQISHQIQREADLRAVIPELEARLAMLSGDFESQRKLQKQLEKQRGQLAQDLERLQATNQPSNGDEYNPNSTYVEFLQPWGGYREGMFQLVASLSEEVAADLVDAEIVQYVAGTPYKPPTMPAMNEQ